jgi:aspartyl-tRNA(Asn)/glutamyl-tRNA(Gln) amidotransferase subunit B
MDYRYFPEPDLLPIELSDDFIDECRKQIGELPIEKRMRYLKYSALGEDDVRILTLEKETSDYFENLVELTGDAKKSCSYITSILMALMNASYEIKKFSNLRFEVGELAEVIKFVNADELSSINSKTVIEELFEKGGKTSEIVERLGLRQKNDLGSLEAVVDDMIAQFPTQVADYKSGNEKIF